MCSIQLPGERVSSCVIGEITGMSHAAAENIAHRAIRKIRRRLKGFDLDDLRDIANKAD
jgi:hypothetical protein